MLPMHMQPKTTSSINNSLSPSESALWRFETTSFEPTTPETFLALDPAGFLTHNRNNATKGSCISRFGRAPSTIARNCWSKGVEPLREPCTDEIPWTDLVFWLGNPSTGEVVCSCAQCSRRAMQNCKRNLLRQHRYLPYVPQQQQQLQQRVSSRVPVINLPRIEGVN
ncbi:unnamed protein product [Peronospora belbahrii]|uniref:Cryptic loci regulator 2 N-terminal domain-containing protein n=1 Tax=Peronospora belbahrii TaxID=622444 RepID=A0AAU9KMF3_9STRA|nr:unnamed protein product [Peronospora belbahrii]CAH0516827.1 unnamed protein product [Peronospora belbahrii]